MRLSQARSSSSLRALASDSIGCEVLDLLELLERRAAHALGRRVRREQLGVLALEVAQLAQQRVVLGVADLRVVEDVVAVVVVLELPPQLVGARSAAGCS